jgi:hypothetical protein
MKECIDEGTLQAWFDGELGVDAAAAVASHLASCPSCAASARIIECENLLLSRALETEFAESVPTNRIRQKIDAAIAESQTPSPARIDRDAKPGWWVALGSLLFPSPQRTFAYAGLAAIVILSAIFALVYFKRNDVIPVAQNAPDMTPGQTVATPAVEPSPLIANSGSITNKTPKPASVDFPQKPVARKRSAASTATAGLLPGERGYVRTIAALDKSIKSDTPMRPSLQVEYEHNVAVLDSAIEMTRDAVKKNPRDTQASQFMFAAYQSKVDLLNQVADARRFNTQK